MTHPKAPRLARVAGCRATSRAGALILLGEGGLAQVLEGPSAELGRALLAELGSPRSREELRAAIASLSGQEVPAGGVVDQLLDALVGFGALREVDGPDGTAPLPGRRPIGPHPHVVLGLTGAVHSLLAPTIVQALQARGMEVRVAATRSALRMVRAAGLEALTHHAVASSMWSRDPERPVPHLELARWADLVLVCPASATTIARLARGDFSDLVAAVALSTHAPVLVAPSMNEAMLDAPAVRRNLAQLAEDGLWIVEPALGIEVADAPGARGPHRGTAPRAEVVADLASLLVARARASAPASDPSALPADAAAWEALWADPREGARAWDEHALDPEALAGLLAAVGPAGRVLDLGTGAGLVAAALARAGHRVVATDVSRAALDRARVATDGLDVTLVVDDATDSSLVGPFDAIVDRGCLHALPVARRAAYVEGVARLARAGGALLLVVDAPGAPRERATHRLEEAEVRGLFEGAFDLEAVGTTALRHLGEASPARMFRLRRRG